MEAIPSRRGQHHAVGLSTDDFGMGFTGLSEGELVIISNITEFENYDTIQVVD